MRTRLATTILLLALSGCPRADDPFGEREPGPGPASHSVPWVAARDAAGHPLLEIPAAVVAPASAEATISPPATTRILQVFVQVGDEVRAGQPLAEVVMPEILEAAGRLAAAEIRIEAQSRRREQLLGLREHGLVRTADLAEAEAALAEARAERVAALAVLGSAGISGADARKLLARGGATTLESPIDGVVLSVDAPLGSVHEAGSSPLFRIGAASTGRIVGRASASIPENATFVWIGSDGTEVSLSLRASSPLIDPRDGTREVFFDPEVPLRPGLTGKVQIRLPEGTAYAAVPARAVFLRDGEARVFALEAAGVREVPVRVVTASGTDAVVEGLVPGARVASDAGRYAASQAEAEGEVGHE